MTTEPHDTTALARQTRPSDAETPALRTDPTPTRLPLASLLALAVTCFVTLLSETLPAGLLLQMSDDLGISTSTAGQTVTVFAVGCLVGAIPLTSLTASLPRRAVVVGMLLGFVVVNTATALAPSLPLLLATRFLAGLGAGMTWALIPSYARRLSPPHLAGRAIALTALGSTLALAVGVPAGTALGELVGWRWTFGVLSVVALGLVVWVRLGTADVPGTPRSGSGGIATALRVPGVRSIIVTAAAVIVAHNLLYTYIAPYLVDVGLGESLGRSLLVFGAGSIAGAIFVGIFGDSHLRHLAIGSAAALVGSLVLLGTVREPVVLLVTIAVWGAVFGSIAPVLQTASARAAGASADAAQSVVVTVWNLAIALGGAVGGVGLAVAGAGALPLLSLPLAMVALVIVVGGRRYAFPAGRGTASPA
ncbi:MFS transporter [Sanguibacter sp. 4.1]|uniref:MFS transporter n=1 Tax=Sanguibacter biliveldensis TaxID=3030830 RepID=A0AAF0Z6Q5_9MICO|nr:MFS transporter [Sanguibacter sp. 4.1]WPF81103.1 MFS transporter [Sanguibacter sp. 4.1]